MRKIWWVVLLVLGCLASEAASQAVVAKPNPGIRSKVALLDIRFGIWDEAGRFVETTEVPLRLGTLYGWRARVPAGQEIHWREQFTLPVAPLSWGSSDGIVSADGRTSTTEGTVVAVPEPAGESASERGPAKGWIGHDWRVIEGDPAGPATVRVELDGKTVREFRVHFRE